MYVLKVLRNLRIMSALRLEEPEAIASTKSYRTSIRQLKAGLNISNMRIITPLILLTASYADV
jgi:hypothetical protein